MDRRTYLGRAGALAAAALAGCSALGGWTFPDGTPTERQRTVARTFVERVHAGEYRRATEPFTDELAAELPPERVESVWVEQVGELGAYEGISRWGHRTSDGNDLVFARVHCAGGYYDLQLTLAGEQVAGVFIRDVVAE